MTALVIIVIITRNVYSVFVSCVCVLPWRDCLLLLIIDKCIIILQQLLSSTSHDSNNSIMGTYNYITACVIIPCIIYLASYPGPTSHLFKVACNIKKVVHAPLKTLNFFGMKILIWQRHAGHVLYPTYTSESLTQAGYNTMYACCH